jgi:hypothetical protein
MWEPTVELSAREKQLVILLVTDHTLQASSARIGVSLSTGREYLRRARAKYRKQERPADSILLLFRRAIEDGLIEPVMPIAWSPSDAPGGV